MRVPQCRQQLAKFNLCGAAYTFRVRSRIPGAVLEQREPELWFAKQNESTISYPAHGNVACLAVEDRSFWFRNRNHVIVEFVRRFHRRGMFLDICGGNGFVAKALISARHSRALIEPGSDGAFAARARGVDPVICAPLESVGLPAGCARVNRHVRCFGAYRG